MATTIRYIDTTGLPPGFDVGDLVKQGTTPAQALEWCKARVRPGLPPAESKPSAVAKPKPAPTQEKAPATAGNSDEGRARSEGDQERRPNIPAAPRPSTPAVVAHHGNVATIQRPEPEPAVEIPPEYSDDSLAEAFAARYDGEALYVADWKRWMLWRDDALWKSDSMLAATHMSRQVCREHGNEALVRPDLASKARSIATALTSARTIGNVERLARSDPRLAASATQWDHDPWALNTPGGIVDLQTGTMRRARKDDYVTKSTIVAPGGDCPTWLRFLEVATAGDKELQGFMQRMAGYCLTGITREHALFFVYGTGGNGKGTFLNTMNWLLNTYARTASMETFVEQKFNSNADTASIAGLMGARMVTAQEVQEGKRWNAERLKEMTGGDVVTARFLHSNPFEYLPQFKLVFAGNHKPTLRNVDEAIKRRLHLIPFTVTVKPEDRDVHLSAKLREEAAGILQWAIDGCIDWQNNFLAPPHSVLVATEDYFVEEDSLGTFFDECCYFDSNARVETGKLYQRYQRWCAANGEFTLPRKRWLQQLEHKNMQSLKIGGNMVIEGLRLNESSSAPPSGWLDDER